MRKIVYAGHPVLSEVARRVGQAERAALPELYTDMLRELKAHRAQGISAPQLGVPLRAFVINAAEVPGEGEPWIAVNPEVVSRGRLMGLQWETCLSVPHYAAQVTRPCKVTVRYETLEGEEVERKLDDREARVFQHELDHLNGVLYTERADMTAFLHESAFRHEGQPPPSPASVTDKLASAIYRTMTGKEPR